MTDLDPRTLLFLLGCAPFAVIAVWMWLIHFGPLR